MYLLLYLYLQKHLCSCHNFPGSARKRHAVTAIPFYLPNEASTFSRDRNPAYSVRKPTISSPELGHQRASLASCNFNSLLCFLKGCLLACSVSLWEAPSPNLHGSEEAGCDRPAQWMQSSKSDTSFCLSAMTLTQNGAGACNYLLKNAPVLLSWRRKKEAGNILTWKKLPTHGVYTSIEIFPL